MAKKKISVTGIQIQTIIASQKRKGVPTLIEFQFTISRGTPADPLFYSSPRLRDLIKEHPDFMGHTIGFIAYYHRRGRQNRGLVFSENYRPFANIGGRAIGDFLGKGIARDLERKTLKDMRKLFGNPIIEPSFGVSSRPRAKQISARGIRVYEDTAYSATVKKMLSGIENLKKQARKRRR